MKENKQMNITIKMLSISTFVLWIIIIFFSATAVISVTGLDVGIGEPQALPSGSAVSFSLPFYIDNGGYYELSNLNLTSLIADANGTVLDQTETIIPSIPQGANVSASHTISIDLDEIIALNYLTLLFKDSYFTVEGVASIDYANVIPVQIKINTTIPWGAPLANFSSGKLTVSAVNNTHSVLSVPISFENNAVIGIDGILKMEVYNNLDQFVTSGEITVDAPPNQAYSNVILAYPTSQEALLLTDTGNLHFLFETPMFTVNWWEPYD